MTYIPVTPLKKLQVMWMRTNRWLLSKVMKLPEEKLFESLNELDKPVESDKNMQMNEIQNERGDKWTDTT